MVLLLRLVNGTRIMMRMMNFRSLSVSVIYNIRLDGFFHLFLSAWIISVVVDVFIVMMNCY